MSASFIHLTGADFQTNSAAQKQMISRSRSSKQLLLAASDMRIPTDCTNEIVSLPTPFSALSSAPSGSRVPPFDGVAAGLRVVLFLSPLSARASV